MSAYKSYTAQNELTFNEYLSRVFMTVGIGLGITTVTAFLFSMFYRDLYYMLGDAFVVLIIGLAIAELVVAIIFSARLNKMSKQTAWTLYIAYSVLTGVSLTGIITAYTSASVWICFAITGVMFVCMTLIGHNTRVDLSRFSGLVVPALIALIGATLINVFLFRSDFMQWVITYAGILIFLFLIAYDMQMLRSYYNAGFNDNEMFDKLMIMGAFQLYLDFINLFIRILRIFGKRND